MPPEPDVELGKHFRDLMKGAPRTGMLETMSHGPDLSEAGIVERVESTESALRRIVDAHLGGDSGLREIATRIAREGGEALKALGKGAGVTIANRGALEVIVRTDGSRPSFMVRGGFVDVSTSPVGTWGTMMASRRLALGEAVGCVGRIDLASLSQGFAGTGCLVAPDVIMTNRHVLQEVGVREADGTWRLDPAAAIDFGHEFRGRASVSRRALKSVLFAGKAPIVDPLDHTKLDLALIEVAPADAGDQGSVLDVDLAPDWAEPETTIFVVGFPGHPGNHEPLSLLEQLFQVTFGCKRVAPGSIMRHGSALAPWTLTHDATTLGGNSGSVLLVAGREKLAAGLHYGGTRGTPRENWGHVLGMVLDQTDGRTSTTLRQVISRKGIKLVDRLGGTPP